VYLPVSTMVPVFLGGSLRWWLERRAVTTEDADARRERGVLFGSGLVGGEGLMGVLIAGMAAWAVSQDHKPWSLGMDWAGSLAPWFGALALAGLIAVFWRIATARNR
jgi:hypothetical protein